MARRSLQAVDWATLFREWRASGLTQPEFCRRRDIPLHTFRRRLYHPAAKNGAGDASSPRAAPPETGPPSCTPSPRFIPVRVVAEDQPVPEAVIPSTPGRPVEVILACGRRIAVPPGFDAETLLRIVTLLEPRGC